MFGIYPIELRSIFVDGLSKGRPALSRLPIGKDWVLGKLSVFDTPKGCLV